MKWNRHLAGSVIIVFVPFSSTNELLSSQPASGCTCAPAYVKILLHKGFNQ
jgi:hypothetical protein